jgi:serine/threonine protein phosphatase PrpC
MEDEYVVAQDFAAVFDGHGGKAVSKYLRQNLFAHLQAALPSVLYHRQQLESTQLHEESNHNSETTTEKSDSGGSSSSTEPTVKDYCIALRLALDKVDQEVQRISHWSYQGSTAVAAWLHHNTTTSSETGEEDTETTLIVANVGDSRAVYGRDGKAFPLTRDHKPDDPIETQRIEQVGGSVVWCGPYGKDGKPVLEKGVYRVNGNLALSRAVGDRSERPAVTAEPDITYLQVRKKTDENPRPKEYIILATDGLWDVFTNQEVVQLVDLLLDRTKGELRHQRDRISDVLVREALRRGTYDNVTVILIWLCTGDEEESEQEAL